MKDCVWDKSWQKHKCASFFCFFWLSKKVLCSLAYTYVPMHSGFGSMRVKHKE